MSPAPTGSAPDAGPADEGLRAFGHYRLLKELGRGAQGVVFLAQDGQLQRKVALKMLEGRNLSDVVRGRFQREAEVTSRLSHPGICGIYEVGEIEGVPYIAMQYVRGTTLAEMIEEARRGGGHGAAHHTGSSLTGKDSLQDVLALVERIARALHVAHEAGLVHRDIKPANIMVSPEGEPVLLDFGLARDVEDQGHTLTETGTVLGTPAYMAAEQLRGARDQIDRRTDVYALGVTLYECLTLRRPFESQSFEELFQLILQGTPVSPRRLNPRIPPDLATIVEVAMERDRARRYPSALALAEDLRRLRSFEPIQAKAAGVLTRAWKWARRRPAIATASAALVCFVFAGMALFLGRDLSRRAQVRGHLERAAALLAAGDAEGGIVAVAQARALAPRSVAAVELETRLEEARRAAQVEERRRADLAAAAAAIGEARAFEREHGELRARILAQQETLAIEHKRVGSAAAPADARAAFAAGQEELRRLVLKDEESLQRAREALERAARFEANWGTSPQTEAAFAAFYLNRWREAVETRDGLRESIFGALVERHDAAGAHRDELLGRGTFRIGGLPPGGEVFLFRYEPYETQRPGAVLPRLVPVATGGIGVCREGPWALDFHTGDACLVVAAVAPESAAARAGLRAGDLVIALDGQPVGDGLFVAEPPAEGLPGLAFHRRIAALNGWPVEQALDWERLPVLGEGRGDRIRFHGEDAEIEFPRGALETVTAHELLERGGRAPIEVACLKDGELLHLRLAAGERAGLALEPSANALIRSPENRVDVGRELACDPGSYLALVLAPGHEPQRVAFVVPRQGQVSVEVRLLPQGASPPGFVRVPGGPFVRAGDPAAKEPAVGEVVHLPGFWIARRELDNAAWSEFLADPAVQERIAASPEPILVPRERQGPMPAENLGGPTTPVMGLSRLDAQAYLDWLNARATAAGEAWEYDLASAAEWEKAARGVDGRTFPWGDRWDNDLCVTLLRKPYWMHDVPGGFEPRDESPWGVQDLAGHRREWTAELYGPPNERVTLYQLRGGSWRDEREQDFRAASVNFGDQSWAAGITGLRLVARERRTGSPSGQ